MATIPDSGIPNDFDETVFARNGGQCTSSKARFLSNKTNFFYQHWRKGVVVVGSGPGSSRYGNGIFDSYLYSNVGNSTGVVTGTLERTKPRTFRIYTDTAPPGVTGNESIIVFTDGPAQGSGFLVADDNTGGPYYVDTGEIDTLYPSNLLPRVGDAYIILALYKNTVSGGPNDPKMTFNVGDGVDKLRIRAGISRKYNKIQNPTANDGGAVFKITSSTDSTGCQFGIDKFVGPMSRTVYMGRCRGSSSNPPSYDADMPQLSDYFTHVWRCDETTSAITNTGIVDAASTNGFDLPTYANSGSGNISQTGDTTSGDEGLEFTSNDNSNAAHLTSTSNVDRTFTPDVSLTWACGIKYTSVAHTQCIVSVEKASNLCFRVEITSGGTVNFNVSTNGSSYGVQVSSASALTNGNTYTISGSYFLDNTHKAELYIDGVLSNTTDTATTASIYHPATTKMRIGATQTGITNAYAGDIYWVAYAPLRFSAADQVLINDNWNSSTVATRGMDHMVGSVVIGFEETGNWQFSDMTTTDELVGGYVYVVNALDGSTAEEDDIGGPIVSNSTTGITVERPPANIGLDDTVAVIKHDYLNPHKAIVELDSGISDAAVTAGNPRALTVTENTRETLTFQVPAWIDVHWLHISEIPPDSI